MQYFQRKTHEITLPQALRDHSKAKISSWEVKPSSAALLHLSRQSSKSPGEFPAIIYIVIQVELPVHKAAPWYHEMGVTFKTGPLHDE